MRCSKGAKVEFSLTLVERGSANREIQHREHDQERPRRDSKRAVRHDKEQKRMAAQAEIESGFPRGIEHRHAKVKQRKRRVDEQGSVKVLWLEVLHGPDGFGRQHKQRSKQMNSGVTTPYGVSSDCSSQSKQNRKE